jgi:hypothetical protein
VTERDRERKSGRVRLRERVNCKTVKKVFGEEFFITTVFFLQDIRRNLDWRVLFMLDTLVLSLQLFFFKATTLHISLHRLSSGVKQEKRDMTTD